MLHGEGQVLLREVEHVKDAVLRATVLAVVDGAYHLYDGLTLVYHLRLTIQTDDGQFTLHQYTVVHSHVMVPAEFLTSGENVLHGYQFGTSLKVVGQLHAVPTLAGTNQFGTYHFGSGIIFIGFCFLTGVQYTCATKEGGGENPLQNLFHFYLDIKNYYNRMPMDVLMNQSFRYPVLLL